MGEVYLAEDPKLGRKVALKILLADVAGHDHLRRFVQEAKAASALNHPNILTIYEIDDTDGEQFITTEFIDGETLRERMRKGPVTTPEAVDVGIQAASALCAAHSAGIVHRDIKPENIMLRHDGIVKVLDFGLAKLAGQRPATSADMDAPTEVLLTEAGMILGTAHYMSPEQARGLDVDARTDIWSLGCVFYEMLAGRQPFSGITMLDVLTAIVNREPDLLTPHLPEELPELQRIVCRALRKDREQRYQTVKELLIDLQDLQEQSRVAVKKDSPTKANGRDTEGA
jgi:serine/threonine protein kinase